MQVSPIPEESIATTTTAGTSRRASYASSAAIPPGAWNPQNFESSRSSDDRHARLHQHYGSQETLGQRARPSPPSPQQLIEDEDPTLVRQASFGRKSKPTLTTIRSKKGKSSSQFPLPPHASVASASTSLPRTTTGAGRSFSSETGSTSPLSQPPLARVSSQTYASGAFDKELGRSRCAFDKEAGFRSPTEWDAGRTAFDNEVSDTRDTSSSRKATGSSGASSRRFKLPRLNSEAIGDSESRGSLTSLPDLIRRATRLAAALERGRRPSSQLWGGRGSMFNPSKSSTGMLEWCCTYINGY